MFVVANETGRTKGKAAEKGVRARASISGMRYVWSLLHAIMRKVIIDPDPDCPCR
jgi:hypothetical protein